MGARFGGSQERPLCSCLMMAVFLRDAMVLVAVVQSCLTMAVLLRDAMVLVVVVSHTRVGHPIVSLKEGTPW